VGFWGLKPEGERHKFKFRGKYVGGCRKILVNRRTKYNVKVLKKRGRRGHKVVAHGLMKMVTWERMVIMGEGLDRILLHKTLAVS